LDPVQPPDSFFASLREFFHSASIYLDLSPPVKQYFDQLVETGETEYIALIEQQKQLLQIRRRWEIHEDLGVEVRRSQQQFDALARLELALEGKYVDFRISPTLEAMNFIFDRGGKVLYKIAAKQSRMQGFEDELTIHFANLRLEGRDKYRLILAGELGATFEPGTKISAEIRINEGAGFRRQPEMVSSEARVPEQRNFEFDFEAPDVPTISDLRVSIPAHHPIRTALLFVRHRFYAARVDSAPAAPSERRPAEPYERPRPSRYTEPPAQAPEPPARRPEAQPERPQGFRRVVRPEPPGPGGEEPSPAPWETQQGGRGPAHLGQEPPRRSRFDDPDEPPPPRRRRRLE
jgi:hypothetical protein